MVVSKVEVEGVIMSLATASGGTRDAMGACGVACLSCLATAL